MLGLATGNPMLRRFGLVGSRASFQAWSRSFQQKNVFVTTHVPQPAIELLEKEGYKVNYRNVDSPVTFVIFTFKYL